MPGVIFNRAHDQRNLAGPDVQLLATDDLARWSTLTAGRWPAPCAGTPCEVVLASHGAQADALPAKVTVAGVEVRVVGRAELTSSLPFERPDLDAARAYGNDPTDVEPDPPPAYLLAEGSRAAAANTGLADVGRTYRWTAPLRADAVHAWTVEPVTGAIAGLQRELAGTIHEYAVRSPSGAIGNEVARGRTAAGRLELVGALALAVLVAFAVFAGVVVRSDVGLEIRRLRRSGATAVRVGTFLALEVLLPALVAGIVGFAIGTLVVAWLAGATGTPLGPLLVAASGQPGTIALAVATVLVAAGGVLAGILVTPRRGFILGLLPGLLAVGGVLAWQLVAGEGLGDQLLRGALGGPVLVLLPALLAFGVAGAFLVVVPLVLRAVARRSGRFPLPTRLAFLSLARDPARPAATLTLLALSVGALVFAAAYGATVRTGIADGAAFETGADLRVAEAGTGLILSGTVVPVDRYGALGPGVEAWPVVHRTTRVEPAGAVTLLGIDPASVSRLTGWRADFSALSAAEIGRRLSVSGDFRIPGHRLPDGTARLGFDLTLAGDPVKLHAIVAALDGDFSDVFLGTFLAGQSRIDIPLAAGLAGGSVVGLRASDSLIVAGPSHPGSLGRSTLRFRGLDGLIADDTPVDATIVATVAKLIRAPFTTDDLVLPAVVSPDVAAVAAPDGTLSMPLGSAVIRIRVVGVASRFPTVDDANASFVVAAYDPLLLAINGAFPGAGYPDEMWIRTADAATTDRVTDLDRRGHRSERPRSRTGRPSSRIGRPIRSQRASPGALCGGTDRPGPGRGGPRPRGGGRPARRDRGPGRSRDDGDLTLDAALARPGPDVRVGRQRDPCRAPGWGHPHGGDHLQPGPRGRSHRRRARAPYRPPLADPHGHRDRSAPRCHRPRAGPVPAGSVVGGEAGRAAAMTAGVLARGLIAVHPDRAGPVAALRGLDLAVEVGELAAVVGPSGSGKTTLLRLLAGLERPTAGSLDVLGLALARVPPTAPCDATGGRPSGSSSSTTGRPFRRTSPVRRSVALPLAVRGVPARERDSRVDELLERVGLADRGESLPTELSGGEQQRVAVAAALVTRPRLLLADEPTGELDARTAEVLLTLLRELVRETGTTAIVVTHDEAVERVADRTVHLRDGRAIAERRGTSLTALDDALGWHAPPLRVSAETEAGAGRPGGGSRPPATGIGAAVRLDGVSRIYGDASTAVRALEDVSFALAEGGFHVVSGPSGAGKSTLLRLVAGLDDPTSGSVETLGTPMATLDREARARFRAGRLGIVDQGRGLTPFLTARENVALVLAIHGQDPTTTEERAMAALEAVGLAAVAERQPGSLSAGERTRVSIARALASEPELILLDEPTATLDRANADRMGALLAGLAGPRTIVAATHDRALMDRATDRFVLE